jgi:hypothetical protein
MNDDSTGYEIPMAIAAGDHHEGRRIPRTGRTRIPGDRTGILRALAVTKEFRSVGTVGARRRTLARYEGSANLEKPRPRSLRNTRDRRPIPPLATPPIVSFAISVDRGARSTISSWGRRKDWLQNSTSPRADFPVIVDPPEDNLVATLQGAPEIGTGARAV